MLTHQISLDDTFAALAHPIRRQIIEQLAIGDCNVNEIAEPHGVSRPAISQHLKVLQDAGLVEVTKDGRIRRCSLQAAPLSGAMSWILQYRIFWEDLLDEIQNQVETEE